MKPKRGVTHPVPGDIDGSSSPKRVFLGGAFVVFSMPRLIQFPPNREETDQPL
jgi:hypothetical protein